MRSEILSKLIFAAVRGTPIARIAGRVSSLRREVGDSPWNYSVACTRVNRVMLVSLCAETKNPCLRGTKSDSCGRKCISYQVYPVTRITSEGRAEFLRAWGTGRVGQLNLCVETMNPWRGRSELNRHTTRMKIRGSVVSLRFIFSHLPEDKKKKKKKLRGQI